MLSKEYIKELKHNGNGAIGYLVKEHHDSGSLTFILENLGQLPYGFDGSFLPELLHHKSASVRLWAIKTIGKLNFNYLGDITSLVSDRAFLFNLLFQRTIVNVGKRIFTTTHNVA